MLEGVRAYPLGVLADTKEAEAELQLEGVIAPAEQFDYVVTLVPGLIYRFSEFVPGPAFSATLVDPHNGEVLWANRAGLARLGLEGSLADGLVQVDAPREAILMLNGVSDSAAAFLFLASAESIEKDQFAVFRFFNTVSGKYFFTASEAERDFVVETMPALKPEGVGFYASDVPLEGFVPVYRFVNVNDGNYLYTANEGEREVILSGAPYMRFEGVGFFTPAAPSEDTTPIFRLLNFESGTYLYTASLFEKAFLLLKGGWRDEGFAFNAVTADAVDALVDSPLLIGTQTITGDGLA